MRRDSALPPLLPLLLATTSIASACLPPIVVAGAVCGADADCQRSAAEPGLVCVEHVCVAAEGEGEGVACGDVAPGPPDPPEGRAPTFWSQVVVGAPGSLITTTLASSDPDTAEPAPTYIVTRDPTCSAVQEGTGGLRLTIRAPDAVAGDPDNVDPINRGLAPAAIIDVVVVGADGNIGAGVVDVRSVVRPAPNVVLWTGASGDNVGDGANWERGARPQPGETALFPANVPGIPTIALDAPLPFVIIDTGASIDATQDSLRADDILCGGAITGTAIPALIVDTAGALIAGNLPRSDVLAPLSTANGPIVVNGPLALHGVLSAPAQPIVVDGTLTCVDDVGAVAIEDAVLVVEGNALFDGLPSTLGVGSTLLVRGDLRETVGNTGGSGLVAEDGSTVVMQGDGASSQQSISFVNPQDGLANLVVDGRTVIIEDRTVVRAVFTVGAGDLVQGGAASVLSVHELVMRDDTLLQVNEVDLSGNDRDFGARATFNPSIVGLAGATLFPIDFPVPVPLVRVLAGRVDLPSDAAAEALDIVAGAALDTSARVLVVNGNLDIAGAIDMTDGGDIFVVGDCRIDGNTNGLTDGSLTVAGNLDLIASTADRFSGIGFTLVVGDQSGTPTTITVAAVNQHIGNLVIDQTSDVAFFGTEVFVDGGLFISGALHIAGPSSLHVAALNFSTLDATVDCPSDGRISFDVCTDVDSPTRCADLVLSCP